MTQSPSAPAAPDLEIVEQRVYRGPNIWNYEQAIHLVVDLGVLEEYPSNLLPGLTEGLLEWLPGLGNHVCSRGKPGGFVERMQEGTWVGHIAEHLALQLQTEAGHDLRRGKTRGVRGKPGFYNVIYAYLDERVGLAAGELAVRMVNTLVAHDEAFDFETELDNFLRLAQRTAFGPSTNAILEEAVARDIPFIRLNTASLVQLGQGVHAQRIRATMTSKTGALAVDIAGDKSLTNSLLSSAGLPVPLSDTVRTEDGAVSVANRIGYPVVVKPLDGNHGRGVGINLRNEAEVRAHFPVALEQSRRGVMVVESFITGNDYRCLIVDGKMQAIAERVPAHVIGDGTHTVNELVEITNADPRRGVGHEKVLTRILINGGSESLVRNQGFDMDEVPPEGILVRLALTGNMSTGGISVDRTFDAHPENVEIAEEAARLIGLDVAGIDFICPDISAPVRETGGAICEVNAAPGFRMHTHPTVGEPQYIASPVVDLLFPPGAPSRVPIVAVTGTNGKTTTARMISHIMKGLGRRVGMTSTDGIIIDERLVKRADASGPKSARMVLQNPRVDFAVMEVARGGILREGLGYDRNDVAVVTNVSADHLGLRGIDTVEQLAAVKRVIVEAVPRNGFAVLNADDPNVRNMRKNCSGSIIYFSLQPPGSEERQFIETRLRRGGRAVVLEPTERGEMIVIKHGRRSMQLAWTHLLPSTFGGAARFNIANAMAAAGAAFAVDVPLHDIRQGLRTFNTSYYLSPGRLNMLDVKGVTVVVDYCHNPAGMRAIGEFVDNYAAQKEAAVDNARVSRIGVVGGTGDRRDDDLAELGYVAAKYFDVIVVREDDNPRGRPVGESAEHVVRGINECIAAGEARTRHVETVVAEVDAVRAAMVLANAGDLLIACVDKHARVLAELEEMSNSAYAGSRSDEVRTGDPDLDPAELHEAAEASAEEARGDYTDLDTPTEDDSQAQPDATTHEGDELSRHTEVPEHELDEPSQHDDAPPPELYDPSPHDESRSDTARSTTTPTAATPVQVPRGPLTEASLEDVEGPEDAG